MTLVLNLAFIQKPQKPLTDEGLHKSSQEESTLSINGKYHSTISNVLGCVHCP